MTEFNQFAPSAHAVFYRSYSRRKEDGSRENFAESITRTINAIAKVGKFTSSQTALALEMALKQHCFPSGRALWVAGTEWSEKPDNFPGYYNCCSMHVDEPSMFGLLMELAMMGTGTGAVLESDVVAKLPAITRAVSIIDVINNQGLEGGKADTAITYEEEDQIIYLTVGDSRQGWASAYQGLIELAMGNLADGESAADDVNIILDLSEIRQAGQLLKGFGGTANPVRLQETFERAAKILLKAKGRKLTAIECCLLIDEAASAVVAGNIRRCLPGNALVHTELGLVPIRDIKIGTMVQTSKGLRPVVDFFDQGKQVIYEIKTQDGSLFCSKEHKVAVLRDIYGAYEMVKAIDLKAGDRMVGNHLIVAGHSTSLPVAANTKANSRKPRKPITIPKLDKEVAYFLGYLHGNGNVKSDGSGIRITGPSGFEAIATRCSSVLQRFGFDSRLVSKSDASAWELTANGCELNAYFRNFKQVFSQPIIPDCILQGTEEIRWHYLGGLMDSDGSPGTHVLLNSVYPEFSHQIQAIYSSLGVPTRIEKRLRKNNHECELNAVGLHKQKIYQVFSSICTRYPCLATKPSDTSRNQHGFDKEMVKASIKGINWSQCQAQKSCVSLAAIEPAMTDLIPITVIDVQPTSRIEDTFDIEVKDIHEFYCNGYLVSNSAGMRQFTSSDEEAASAKDGLYKQDESGNWSVDPEKEALRMANHTRCFHTKPDHETIKASIEKQFWSGEGAIMYVPESIARANADLLNTEQLKQRFLGLYTRSQDDARQMLVELAEKAGEPTDDRIIQHRMDRYGLNPCGEILMRDNLCVAGDTPIITEDGISPIKDLAGTRAKIWNGQKFCEVEPFQTGTNDKLYRVSFSDGTYLDVTGAHKFWVKHRFMREYIEVDTIDLANKINNTKYKFYTEDFIIGDTGYGIDEEQAYTIGLLVGDGRVFPNGCMELELYGNKMKCPVSAINKTEPYLKKGYKSHCIRFSGFRDIDPNKINDLKNGHEEILRIGKWNKKSILQFVAGLADSDGCNTTANGIRIYLSDYKRAEAVYLLLQKCGIKSSINFMAKAGEVTNYGTRSRDMYYLQITNCRDIPCYRLDTSKGKPATSKGKHQIVVSVSPVDGEHETFCFTEPELHKGVFKGTLTGQCNLSEVHLNTLDPVNKELQHQAFYAGGLQVAALLQHKFVPERLAYSRENDPIVGVSFTGLFDFFVHAFGASWLKWMMKGRPSGSAYKKYTAKEKAFLESWRISAEQGVRDYCAQHEIRLPNRFTTVQPAGSKSLLTGASSGWHPPKAQRFIRRITFGVNDPLVSALRDYGYSVIPAQSARDDEGNLLDDITDPRVREVLVEIPTEVSWANLPGCDEFDLSKLPVTAQWGLYMQVQKYYTTHNTSATLEFRENEIDELASLIYQDIQSDGGYISAALLARFDANETFPRLPFEPIDKQTFDRRMAVVKLVRDSLPEGTTMLDLLSRYDNPGYELKGAAGCDSDKCLAEEKVPFSK